MKLLIVGAGASIAEGKELGVPQTSRLPSIDNFADVLWKEFNPGFSLRDFLLSQNCEINDNKWVEAFIHFGKKDPEINIERYFEFLWRRLNVYGEEEYYNILYHGIYNSILFIMITTLWDVGAGKWKEFSLSRRLASRLNPGDICVNLNYDTIFDIALCQAGVSAAYLPNKHSVEQVIIAKPHGSLNLMVDPTEGSFWFGAPMRTGDLPRKGQGVHFGFVPPRFGKRYAQHPIAREILRPIVAESPSALIFCGVGLTDSDIDLLELYQRWSKTSGTIDFINPSRDAAERAEKLLGRRLTRFDNIEHWLSVA